MCIRDRLEKETDAGKRMALKTEANNAVADMVKKEAADTLDKVLFELCGHCLLYTSKMQPMMVQP